MNTEQPSREKIVILIRSLHNPPADPSDHSFFIFSNMMRFKQLIKRFGKELENRTDLQGRHLQVVAEKQKRLLDFADQKILSDEHPAKIGQQLEQQFETLLEAA